MATILERVELPQSGADSAPLAKRIRRTRLYFWLAIACAVVGIGGFAPTWWLQLPARTFDGPPLLHIHGALATAWILFLVSQSLLVTRGRIRNHRDWGLAGIALATMLAVIAIVVAIDAMQAKVAAGHGDAARAFLIVPLSAIGLFAGFTAAAIANVRRPEWHRRFMIAGTVGLVEAAMARVFFVMATGGGPGIRPGVMPPPPVTTGLVPGLLLELILVAGMIHDWRRRGRVHPAWIYAFLVMTTVGVLRIPIGQSPTWNMIAEGLGRIGG